ncbi:hypothetical protein [Pseudomonas aeruginosa]|uniref:hypothetical protein n=1 Tax=Pseudomonas aeruginosa TaxID=287 RepID=UPI00057AE683|nr:hypothetical protein [Pseudomonas aeruginosa]
MADAYPIVPLSFIDGLHDLNTALEVYNQLVQSWVQRALDGDLQGDPQTFLAGLDFMFKPILQGYQGIHDQCAMCRDMGMVGIATLDPGVAPGADRD